MKPLANLLIACTIADVLGVIAPGATWNVRGDSYAGIEWQDSIQAKPTQAAVTSAISSCQSTLDTNMSAKAQAKQIVKDTTKSQAQRFSALLVLLDLDK